MKFKIKTKGEFKPLKLEIEINTKDEYLALMSFIGSVEPQTWMYADDLFQLLEEHKTFEE